MNDSVRPLTLAVERLKNAEQGLLWNNIMASNTLLVLTNAPTRIAVSSPDLKPGLLAEVTLTFSKAGPVTMLVPVVSSSEPEYECINVTG